MLFSGSPENGHALVADVLECTEIAFGRISLPGREGNVGCGRRFACVGRRFECGGYWERFVCVRGAGKRVCMWGAGEGLSVWGVGEGLSMWGVGEGLRE